MRRIVFLIPVIAWLLICTTQDAHAVSTVPEPTSFLLVGAGIAGLLGLWRAFK